MSKTIVWIEDDVELIRPVVRPLEESGYHIICLRTVHEALMAIEQIRGADLVLLDMILPPGEADIGFVRYAGIDILRKLREVYSIDTPVIVFSVVANAYILDELRTMGVADLISKPVLPSELKRRVDEVIERTKLRGQTP